MVSFVKNRETARTTNGLLSTIGQKCYKPFCIVGKLWVRYSAPYLFILEMLRKLIMRALKSLVRAFGAVCPYITSGDV